MNNQENYNVFTLYFCNHSCPGTFRLFLLLLFFKFALQISSECLQNAATWNGLRLFAECTKSEWPQAVCWMKQLRINGRLFRECSTLAWLQTVCRMSQPKMVSVSLQNTGAAFKAKSQRKQRTSDNLGREEKFTQSV